MLHILNNFYRFVRYTEQIPSVIVFGWKSSHFVPLVSFFPLILRVLPFFLLYPHCWLSLAFGQTREFKQIKSPEQLAVTKALARIPGRFVSKNIIARSRQLRKSSQSTLAWLTCSPIDQFGSFTIAWLVNFIRERLKSMQIDRSFPSIEREREREREIQTRFVNTVRLNIQTWSKGEYHKWMEILFLSRKLILNIKVKGESKKWSEAILRSRFFYFN